jgi:hypothetical protein
VRDALEFQLLLGPTLGVDGAEVIDLGIGEGFNLFVFLVGDADDDELFAKFPVEGVEFGDGFAAGAAPGCPEVDEDELAFAVGFLGKPIASIAPVSSSWPACSCWSLPPSRLLTATHF